MAQTIDRLKGTVKCFHGMRVGENKVEEDVDELPAGEQRYWADLPTDVLSVIFKKIAAIEIIRSAQFVCKSWRHLSCEPELWRYIDMTGHVDFLNMIDKNTIAMEAVRRSSGCLEEFHGKYVGNNELIIFMSGRVTLLRCLRLTAAHEITSAHEMNGIYRGLFHTLLNFRLLEELEFTFFSFSHKVVEFVGRAWSHLKTFRLNERPLVCYANFSGENHDSKALAIAKHMQQLHYLQLIGNRLTNDGLTAILDNCPYLQHLDIRRCLYVNPDETLKKKLSRIKIVRLPNDSTADCPFDTSFEYDYEDYDYVDCDDFGYHDYDL